MLLSLVIRASVIPRPRYSSRAFAFMGLKGSTAIDLCDLPRLLVVSIYSISKSRKVKPSVRPTTIKQANSVFVRSPVRPLLPFRLAATTVVRHGVEAVGCLQLLSALAIVTDDLMSRVSIDSAFSSCTCSSHSDKAIASSRNGFYIFVLVRTFAESLPQNEDVLAEVSLFDNRCRARGSSSSRPSQALARHSEQVEASVSKIFLVSGTSSPSRSR